MKPKVSVRILCIVSMLIALTFVLERFTPVISTPTLRITLAFIPMMCCGMLLGPFWGAVSYGVADILGWPVMGLMPIPLVLLSRVTEGFLYGLILHRPDAKFLPHAAVNAVSVQIICGAGFTTLGLSIFFAQPYVPLLVSRLPQFAIYFTLQIVLFPALLRLKKMLSRQFNISN